MTTHKQYVFRRFDCSINSIILFIKGKTTGWHSLLLTQLQRKGRQEEEILKLKDSKSVLGLKMFIHLNNCVIFSLSFIFFFNSIP